ncbi:MAG: hypothetical protein K0Q68_311 [Moraxellaceae bacterium]|jgi:hypothetical protein|nr:hypothetical protein [Moraxellaceae bacterium]
MPDLDLLPDWATGEMAQDKALNERIWEKYPGW